MHPFLPIASVRVETVETRNNPADKQQKQNVRVSEVHDLSSGPLRLWMGGRPVPTRMEAPNYTRLRKIPMQPPPEIYMGGFPFWVPNIVRHPIFRVPKKGP